MSENNGDYTTNSNEQPEQAPTDAAAPRPEAAQPEQAPTEAAAARPEATRPESAQPQSAPSESAPSEAAHPAAPRQPEAPQTPVFGQPSPGYFANPPALPNTAPPAPGAPYYASQASPPQAGQQYPAQPASVPRPQQPSGAPAPQYGPPAPQYGAPGSGYGAPAPAANPFTTGAAAGNPAGSNPSGSNPAAGNPAGSNPTERIPAPPAHSAGYPNSGYPNPGSQHPGAQDAGSYGAGASNPTERIPAGFGANSPAGSSAAGHGAGGSGSGEGHAGAGYPASSAYPHALAPAVAPERRRKDGKKVGMGMFSGGILAAALIGGLVGGGSLFLLDQQGNNSATGGTQQSAPLVVNNPNSVNQITAAAAKAMPSVVTISATSGNSGGTGSGIILDTEGHILTNTHVVTLDGAAAHATIQVQTSDNKVYDATIVGTDPLSDLAVIKIDAPNLVPAALGDSGKINVGDSVIAIGSPLGLNATVTEGIVSTLNRTIQVASSAVPETPSDTAPDQGNGGNGFQFSPPGGGQNSNAATGTVNLNVIQTDAAINPGNSGGALVNSEGQVIGVNVAIASTGSSSSSGSQSGNIGVGFSIPMDHAQRVAQDIIKTGKATHGQLGVTVSGTSSSSSGSAFSVGATVADVTAGSAAAKAGLQKGDVITQLGNRTISDPADLTAAVREQPGGATVKMDFTRNGKAQSVDVTLDTMK